MTPPSVPNESSPPNLGEDNALLSVENHILQLIASGEPTSDVLAEIARSAESLCGDGILCSVLLLDESGTRLLHGAAPSLPEEYNRGIHGITIGPSVGSCGTAAYRREPVIVADIAKDPRWAEFKDLALEHGLRACWSTPIYAADGRLLGTFALYYNRASYPTKFASRVIQLLSRTAAIAIEHRGAEKKRARRVGSAKRSVA